MSSFTRPLIVFPLPDGRRWRLVSQFGYHVGSKNSKDVVLVQAGFVTDFASIPWMFWTFLPSWGKYGKAAVVHDYLYRYHTRTRKEADDIFYEAMLVSNTKPWKAKVMYRAVRVFGLSAWKRGK